MSRILVVSSFPPRHCGIGAYAQAQVGRLREQGHQVTVLSPLDGAGDVRVPFAGGRPFATASRMAAAFDRVIVHFEPGLYFRPRAPLSKLGTTFQLMWLLLRRRQTELIIHEVHPPRWWRPDDVLLAVAFWGAPLVLFHTARERQEFSRMFRFPARAGLVSHGEGVTVRGPRSRQEARRRLGIPANEVLLVCPGFLHPGKGVDRAVEAFRLRGSGRLCIVGSVRDPVPSNLKYAERLRRLAEATPGVDFVDGFLEDWEFDAWIAAADAVILPYRRSWSSGVLARAQALGTPAIVTAVGGLPEQASQADVVVHDDDQLAAAVGDVAGRPVPGTSG